MMTMGWGRIVAMTREDKNLLDKFHRLALILRYEAPSLVPRHGDYASILPKLEQVLDAIDDQLATPALPVTAPRPLTPKQFAILTFLTDFKQQHGYFPSFNELCEHFNWSSLATVHEHLSNLERKGWVVREYNEARAITLLHEPPTIRVA
jgi:DNA-binding MarR family transcriptional regulator